MSSEHKQGAPNQAQVDVHLRRKLTPGQTQNDENVRIYDSPWVQQKLIEYGKKLAGTVIRIPKAGKGPNLCPNHDMGGVIIDVEITEWEEQVISAAGITPIQLQYLARNEPFNVDGVIAVNNYRNINNEDILALKALAQRSLIAGPAHMLYQGGFGSPRTEIPNGGKRVFLVDLAAAQFQQLYNEGCRYFIISATQETQLKSSVDDELLKNIVGEPKKTLAELMQLPAAPDGSRASKRYVLVSGQPNNNPEYFDTYAYRKFVEDDVVRAGMALNAAATNAGLADGSLNFKFLAYGTGAFAKPSDAQGNDDPKYLQTIRDNILEGVYQGLEALFAQQPKPTKIGCIELPFYTFPANTPYSPAQKASIRKIEQLCQKNEVEVFFGWEDALADRTNPRTNKPYEIGATTTGDIHVPFGNEMNQPIAMGQGSKMMVTPKGIASADGMFGEDEARLGATFSPVTNKTMQHTMLADERSVRKSKEMLLCILLLKNSNSVSPQDAQKIREEIQTNPDSNLITAFDKVIFDGVYYGGSLTSIDHGTDATITGLRTTLENLFSLGPFQAAADNLTDLYAQQNVWNIYLQQDGKLDPMQWEGLVSKALLGLIPTYFPTAPRHLTEPLCRQMAREALSKLPQGILRIQAAQQQVPPQEEKVPTRTPQQPPQQQFQQGYRSQPGQVPYGHPGQQQQPPFNQPPQQFPQVGAYQNAQVQQGQPQWPAPGAQQPNQPQHTHPASPPSRNQPPQQQQFAEEKAANLPPGASYSIPNPQHGDFLLDCVRGATPNAPQLSIDPDGSYRLHGAAGFARDGGDWKPAADSAGFQENIDYLFDRNDLVLRSKQLKAKVFARAYSSTGAGYIYPLTQLQSCIDRGLVVAQAQRQQSHMGASQGVPGAGQLQQQAYPEPTCIENGPTNTRRLFFNSPDETHTFLTIVGAPNARIVPNSTPGNNKGSHFCVVGEGKLSALDPRLLELKEPIVPLPPAPIHREKHEKHAGMSRLFFKNPNDATAFLGFVGANPNTKIQPDSIQNNPNCYRCVVPDTNLAKYDTAVARHAQQLGQQQRPQAADGGGGGTPVGDRRADPRAAYTGGGSNFGVDNRHPNPAALQPGSGSATPRPSATSGAVTGAGAGGRGTGASSSGPNPHARHIPGGAGAGPNSANPQDVPLRNPAPTLGGQGSAFEPLPPRNPEAGPPRNNPFSRVPPSLPGAGVGTGARRGGAPASFAPQNPSASAPPEQQVSPEWETLGQPAPRVHTPPPSNPQNTGGTGTGSYDRVLGRTVPGGPPVRASGAWVGMEEQKSDQGPGLGQPQYGPPRGATSNPNAASNFNGTNGAAAATSAARYQPHTPPADVAPPQSYQTFTPVNTNRDGGEPEEKIQPTMAQQLANKIAIKRAALKQRQEALSQSQESQQLEGLRTRFKATKQAKQGQLLDDPTALQDQIDKLNSTIASSPDSIAINTLGIEIASLVAQHSQAEQAEQFANELSTFTQIAQDRDNKWKTTWQHCQDELAVLKVELANQKKSLASTQQGIEALQPKQSLFERARGVPLPQLDPESQAALDTLKLKHASQQAAYAHTERKIAILKSALANKDKKPAPKLRITGFYPEAKQEALSTTHMKAFVQYATQVAEQEPDTVQFHNNPFARYENTRTTRTLQGFTDTGNPEQEAHPAPMANKYFEGCPLQKLVTDPTYKYSTGKTRITHQMMLNAQTGLRIDYDPEFLTPVEVNDLIWIKETGNLSPNSPMRFLQQNPDEYRKYKNSLACKAPFMAMTCNDTLQFFQHKPGEDRVLDQPRRIIAYQVVMPELRRGSPDLPLFCESRTGSIREAATATQMEVRAARFTDQGRQDYKEKVKAILRFWIRVAAQNNHALNVSVPNAFFRGLDWKKPNDHQALAKELFVQAVLEVMCDPNAIPANFPGLCLNDPRPEVQDMITKQLQTSKKSLAGNLIVHSLDGGALQYVADKFRTSNQQFPIDFADCTMADSKKPAGHEALMLERASQGKEEQRTRCSGGTMLAAFSGSWNSDRLNNMHSYRSLPAQPSGFQPGAFNCHRSPQIDQHLQRLDQGWQQQLAGQLQWQQQMGGADPQQQLQAQLAHQGQWQQQQMQQPQQFPNSPPQLPPQGTFGPGSPGFLAPPPAGRGGPPVNGAAAPPTQTGQPGGAKGPPQQYQPWPPTTGTGPGGRGNG